MIEIEQFTCENKEVGCVTDNATPSFRYSLSSDRPGFMVMRASIQCNGWSADVSDRKSVCYAGTPLAPYTAYKVRLSVEGNRGEKAEKELVFETGKLSEPWQGGWLAGLRGEKPPFESYVTLFKRGFVLHKPVYSVKIYASAIGCYTLSLNGVRVSGQHLSPGLFSGVEELQYRVYNVTTLLKASNEVGFALTGYGGGERRAALSAEIRILYADGTIEVIGTDESWLCARSSAFLSAEIGRGEVYDATMSGMNGAWQASTPAKVKGVQLLAGNGGLVEGEHFSPVSRERTADGGVLFDFGERFVGTVRLRIRGKAGQRIRVRLAEKNAAGALIFPAVGYEMQYICREGEQEYTPENGYARFRYCLVDGELNQTEEMTEEIGVEGIVLLSEGMQVRRCLYSDERFNRLHRAIDRNRLAQPLEVLEERFARTPSWREVGVIEPALRRDRCIFMPWAAYLETADVQLLQNAYPEMKKYLRKRLKSRAWAFGWKKYIFTDENAGGGKKKGRYARWTGTAATAYALRVTAQVAGILGEKQEEAYYGKLAQKAAEAYNFLLTAEEKRREKRFAGGGEAALYALPLYLKLFSDQDREKSAAWRLASAFAKNGDGAESGLRHAPHYLFALADNGYADVALESILRMTDKALDCVGKQHETACERVVYASAGEFLRRRIVGLEAVEPGYKVFRIAPLIGKGLTRAAAETLTPYGAILCGWVIRDGIFTVMAEVPPETTCRVTLPSGRTETLAAGEHTLQERV